MIVGVSDLGGVVGSVVRYLRLAFWCLVGVAVLEVVVSVLWAFTLTSSGVGVVEVFLYAVLPIVSISLVPTLVAIPLVRSVSKSFIESVFRGDVDAVSRCRKVMAVLGGVTLLSLLVPGVLLIVAFLKSESVELAMLSRRVSSLPMSPYPVR